MARTRTRRLRRAGGLTAMTCVVALSATSMPAHAAPEGQILGAGDPGSVSGSYVVTLKGATRAPSAAGKSLAEKYGAKISHTYDTVLNGYAVRADERQAERLAADPRVASVVQDTRVTLEHTQKNPPSWGLDRIDQANLPLDKSYTWPESAGAGVTVYVIDTGIRVSHKDFGGRASYGWDFVGNDRSAGDGNGHGTHVAGTIAGKQYGVAKKAKVVAVRVLDNAGGGTTAQVIAGIDWVTRHAKKPAVANVSLGGNRNAQLDAAVRNSIAAGVTYTVAAGNDGLPACTPPRRCARPSPSAPPTGRTPGRASPTPGRFWTCSPRACRSPPRRTRATPAGPPSPVRRWHHRTSRAWPRSIWRTTPRRPRHRSPKRWWHRPLPARSPAAGWAHRTNSCRYRARSGHFAAKCGHRPRSSRTGPVLCVDIRVSS
ncbi:hypothetical protein SCHAM137S_04846 [Streptomyces chartreusis]